MLASVCHIVSRGHLPHCSEAAVVAHPRRLRASRHNGNDDQVQAREEQQENDQRADRHVALRSIRIHSATSLCPRYSRSLVLSVGKWLLAMHGRVRAAEIW